MDYTALLFATKVRELAVGMRHAEWEIESEKPEYAGITTRDPKAAEEIKMSWHREHPLSLFVPKAYGFFRDIALQIESLE